MSALKRIAVFSIDEVEAFVGNDVSSWDGDSKQKNMDHNIKVNGYDVYTRSLRYKTFMEKGYECVCCGRKGTHYALEWAGGNIYRAHFNLYSDDEVLMTKDHIYPKSKGGRDCIENMQTMCAICNEKKGNQVPDGYIILPIQKKNDNREYFWCGNKKYRSLNSAANHLCKNSKKGQETVKRRIKDSVQNGTEYCGYVWRYGKETI